MTIQATVAAAQAAIQTLLSTIPFNAEEKTIIRNIKNTLFSKITETTDVSEELKKQEIDIAMIGTFVFAISTYQNNHRGEAYIWYPDHRAFYKSLYYPLRHDQLLKSSVVNNLNATETEALTANELKVLAIGTKIMNGELSFDPITFKEILEVHAPNILANWDPNTLERNQMESNVAAVKTAIDLTATKIKQRVQYYSSFILNERIKKGYHAIEKTFHDALNLVLNRHELSSIKLLVEGLNELKKETLANYTTQKSNFDYDNCVIIATNASKLATQVANNRLTQHDVDEFIQGIQPYKTDNKWTAALATILGAVAGMLVGATVGFLIGGVPATVVGSVSGLMVGGLISGISFTMWQEKNQPLNKISSAAKDMVATHNNT